MIFPILAFKLVVMSLNVLPDSRFVIVEALSTSSSLSTKTRERFLVESAVPLVEESSSPPLEVLIRDGVCRLNQIISPEDCQIIRERILQFQQQPNSNTFQDRRNIPHTRCRFSEPVLSPLNQRTDVLLPVEDEVVGRLLQIMIQRVGSILEEGAEALLPPTNNGGDKGEEDISIQLVEAGALISEYGATDQSLHADFRRDIPNREDKALPPRLVTFLYLQDAPSHEHGPTVFLPATNTKEGHSSFLERQEQSQHEFPRGTARTACLNTGDVAIYDASVLHFGSANKVPNNVRAVFYFGISRLLPTTASSASPSLVDMEPIIVENKGTRKFVHPTVLGMEK